MIRTDVLVEVRDKSLARKGTITPKYLKLKATLRWCNVGEWEITLPGNHPMVPHLSADGSGIVVSLYGAPHFSGPTSKPKRKRDRQNPDGTFTFSGVTDEILLADALAYPQPSNSNVATQNQSNDVRSGKIETLMYAYVSRNIGPLAPAGRRRGMRTAITTGADLARGATAQKSPRFQNLLELEQELALLSGSLGFRMVQIGDDIVFEVVEITDRTDLVRLDIQNGTITSEEVERTGPTITYAIVAGQGAGTDRQIIARTTADSVSAEADWGRPIERFIDQRDTNVTSELEQSGDEALFESGFTATAVKVVPSDNQTMRYAIDWREGDLITVVVNGQETSTTVTAAAMIVDDKVCAVGAAIGDVTGFDKDAALTERVEDIDKRVSRIERTAEIDDTLFVPALADPNADRILFWDDSAGAYAWLSVAAPLSIAGTTLSVDAMTAAATTAAIAAAVAAAVPAGTISATGVAAAPAGYLLCDGQAVSRTTYAALFTAIGTQFGVGNGSTTFNVPNLKGRVIVGVDAAQTEFDVRGETGGAKTHTHTLTQVIAAIWVGFWKTRGIGTNWTATNTGGLSAPAGSGSVTSSGAAVEGTTDAGSTLQPYMALNYIIKT